MATVQTGVATEFIQFTRASNATVTDSDGKVKWAPHNLLTNSESFDAAAWTKVGGLAISANSAVAPNGTTTADLFTEDTANSDHYVAYTFTGVSGPSYTFSAFVKPNGRTWIILNAQDGTRKAVWFNCTGAGSVGTTDAGVTGASITALSNGWYLLTSTRTAAASTFYPAIIPTTGDGVSPPYLGNGTSGVYLWGAALYRSDMGMQANTSAYPMYNPTTPKNLLGYTEDFSNGVWVKSGLLAFGSGSVSNAILAPNGLQTADKITEDTSNGVHLAVQVFTGNTGGSTFSIYAKAAERTILAVGFSAPADCGVYIDLSNGSFVSNLGSAPTSYSADPVGNGWYRISVTNTGANVNNPWVLLSNGSPSTARDSYTGDGVSGIYLWGAQLSDSASLDSYSPVYGAAVTSAAYYGPRRDFDPVTLACKGLLVEEQRTNYLLYSNVFSNVAWTRGGVAPTVDYGFTAPDGSSTAWRVTFPNGSAGSQFYQSLSASLGFEVTQSLWIKADSSLALTYGFYDSTGDTTNITATSTWQKFTKTRAAGLITGDRRAQWLYLTGASAPQSIYIWNAQLEAGSFPTSYIPTGAATATRNADVASVSTQAFPYSASTGSLVVNYNYIGSSTLPYPIALDIGSAVTFFGVSHAANLLNSDQGSVSISPVLNATGLNKVASAYAANDRAVSANSNSANTSASSYTPGTATTLSIGSLANSASYRMNGHIRQITYLPRRISNAELVTRST